ncbi:MAG TPA: hypothetical protein VGH33_03655 [Isosphaeraceae bacterium]|jgi:hypothetical protein
MRRTTRIGIGLATALLALATTGDAKAQVYGGYGGYGYGPYNGVSPSYGYGVGYGYNRGYFYGPQIYYVPETYNNVNGIAGLVGRSVAPRSTTVIPTIRRRR